VIAIVGILSGAVLVALDRPLAGFVSMFGPLGLIVAAFVWGRHQQQRERAQKRAEMCEPSPLQKLPFE
jgi:hypothetical protein